MLTDATTAARDTLAPRLLVLADAATAARDTRAPDLLVLADAAAAATEDGPYAGMAFMGQHDSARLHEAVGGAAAHQGATYCEIPRAPIMFPPVKKVEVTTISPATCQAGVDKTCAKILSECKTMLRCTIIVECLSPCTDGRFRLFGTKKHSRFEDDNAAEQMSARDALDARIRLHPLYRSVFETLFRSKAKEQLKAMQLQDTITLEVSDQERLEADKKGTAPLFSVKSTGLKIENRRTYHEGYMLADAKTFTGTVVHVRTIIDNGLLGSTCTHTHTQGKALLSNTFLRVFIDSPHVVDLTQTD